ncbi:hemerythrin domain-containing protein [Dehalogenimonas etheniformans]|uniref:Cation-binding protein n=2 Tax=Dehalogenimonas etheniformans TaxID=1536648 RepID=A0A2P5P8D3_9CHLR|nr:hemerythrin domain-containing protein [Dehalogenimonas etheniformans]PPD58551.1 cation-binding protein [Dehalogenimonas etheniformans]QNT76685.1 hemerythrin domain-containing protein [Dehalogenimonas etheniformans]
MKPIGPLMWEHRLIERMIALLSSELDAFTQTNVFHLDFLRQAIDFLRTYADKTHHGKEEKIFFRELFNKPLSPEHRRILNELIDEHETARKLVASLDQAVREAEPQKQANAQTISELVRGIVDFYPCHIKKEDQVIFYPAQDYLTKDEQDNMLAEFWEFDRRLIHEKYQEIVSGMESRLKA